MKFKKLTAYEKHFGENFGDEKLVEELESILDSLDRSSIPYDGIIGTKGTIEVHPYVKANMRRDEKIARKIIDKAIVNLNYVYLNDDLGNFKILEDRNEKWYGEIAGYKWKGDSIDSLNDNYFKITTTPKRKLKKWKEFADELQLKPNIEKTDGVVAICTDKLIFDDPEQLKEYINKVLLPRSKKRGSILEISADPADIKIDRKRIETTVYNKHGSDLLPYLVEGIGEKNYVYKEVSKEFPSVSYIKEKLSNFVAVAWPGLFGFVVGDLVSINNGVSLSKSLGIGAISGVATEGVIAGIAYASDRLQKRKEKAKENIIEIARRMPGKCVIVSDTRSAAKVNPDEIEKRKNCC